MTTVVPAARVSGGVNVGIGSGVTWASKSLGRNASNCGRLSAVNNVIKAKAVLRMGTPQSKAFRSSAKGYTQMENFS